MIYFIRQKELVKIGFSSTPINRIGDIIAHSSSEQDVLGVIESTSEQEKVLHCRFKHLHSHREWFNYTSDIQDYIDSCEKIPYVTKRRNKKFFGKLQQLRLEAGLSLSLMAEKLSIRSPSVSDMERGFEDGNIQLKTLNKYLDKIGYEVKIVKKGS